MMRSITDVTAREDFLLQITFDDGEVRIFDLKQYLKGSLFLNFSKEIRGISWPNGADLCADTLYLNSQPYRPALEKASDVSASSHAV